MSDERYTDEDSFADRDEEPVREGMGYAPAKKPAPAKPADDKPRCASGDCKGHPPGAMMFQSPRRDAHGLYQPERTWCSACVGGYHAWNVERTRDAIRGLKAAAAMGNRDDERSFEKDLISIVGAHQAEQTAKAIRAGLAEKPAKGGRR